MAREQYEEVAFQVIHEMDGTIRSGWFPTGTGIVDGNVAVDYVWGGSFPMQPNDDRNDEGWYFGGGEGDAGWDGTWTWNPDTLQYSDYTPTYNNVGGTTNVPADSHTIVRDAWDGFPEFNTIPSVVGTSYLLGETETVLENAGLGVGVVTRTALFNVNGEQKIAATEVNRGFVVSQSPKAGDGNNGGYVDIVVLDPTPSTADTIVPDVVGMNSIDASDALDAVGLVYAATTTYVGGTVANDNTVKTQSVAAGTKVDSGTTVNVVLYSAAVVPDVLGLDETDAESALVAAHLIKGAVTTSAVGATSENDGLVKSSNPAADTVADVDSAVDLVLYAFAG